MATDEHTQNVIPAYLGWGNPERDKVSLRLYATDNDDAPRWDRTYEGGRVVEYAVVERFGQAEGDRFLVVRVGDRFTPDDAMQRVTEAVAKALYPHTCPTSPTGSPDGCRCR